MLGVFRTIYGFTTEGTIQHWHGRRLEQAVPIAMPYLPAAGFFGLRIDAAPDLSEAALVFPESLGRVAFEELAALVRFPAGRPAPGFAGGGLAWSPDGAWLALASADGIRIFGAADRGPHTSFPSAPGLSDGPLRRRRRRELEAVLARRRDHRDALLVEEVHALHVEARPDGLVHGE